MSDNLYSLMSTTACEMSCEMRDKLRLVYDDPRLICVKCARLLINPWQNECGHRICRTCLDDLLALSSGIISCPSGDEDCVHINAKQVHPDASARREINKAKVYCPNEKYGCPETPQFSKIQEHIKNCPWKKLSCQYCKEQVSPDELECHISTSCKEALVSCQYECGISQMKRLEMEEHYLCCAAKPRRCKYYLFGCDVELNKSEMAEHEKNESVHFEIVVKHTAQLQGSLTVLQAEHSSTIQQISELRRENENLNRKLSVLIENQTRNEEKTSQLAQGHGSRLTQLESKFTKLDSKSQEFSTMSAKVAQLELQSLSSTGDVNQTAARIGGLPEDVRKQISTQDRSIGTHDARLAELDIRLQCLETTNFGGVLIWKIGEFSERKRQAIDGRILSLYSQPFYTSRYGYKMCARVYLNGDGIGRNTHMSLFFVIMQGDYDDILSWPFRQKVTLSMLDQVQNRRHLSDTFKPDPSSSSFQKPTSAMNVASGCPLFVAHSVLENQKEPYLRNNTIFKVVVDVSDLSNA